MLDIHTLPRGLEVIPKAFWTGSTSISRGWTFRRAASAAANPAAAPVAMQMV